MSLCVYAKQLTSHSCSPAPSKISLVMSTYTNSQSEWIQSRFYKFCLY